MEDKVLYDRIKACWMGKNIGGTLGGPVEGKMEKLSLIDLPDLSGKGALPNDDLDLQLLNLHIVEQRGFHINVSDFASEWEEHIYFPFDEYGYALTNMRNGMVPPLSSYFNNPFTDCMGSPIRSELWACIAPGNPEAAAYYAYQDAMVDHAGGEGVAGEIFLAALESLAFVESDILTLVDKAAAFAPSGSQTISAIYDTINWYKNGVSYDEVRENILKKYGKSNFTDAPQNMAFVTVGLLYGNGFEDAMLKTVNLGYDTDCTAATLGSIFGIIYGTAGLPEKWTKAVGDNIKISYQVRGFDYPKTITELTERTISLKHKFDLETNMDFHYHVDGDLNAQIYYLPYGNKFDDALAVEVLAENGPLCIQGEDKTVLIRITNHTEGSWDFSVSVSSGNNNSKSERYFLNSQESVSWRCHLKTKANQSSVCNYDINITRFYDGIAWKNYVIPMALPVSSKWKVNNEIVNCVDGYVELNGAGNHKLQSKLFVPDDRKVKLMFASSEPVKVYLDGSEVIVSDSKTPYMPAYHRGPRTLRYTADLSCGDHDITIEVNSSSDQCDIMVMPTTVDFEKEYSSIYMTDCIFHI